jgi:hypothetical protein
VYNTPHLCDEIRLPGIHIDEDRGGSPANPGFPESTFRISKEESMKQRMIWVAMLGLALASTSAAQTKISGTLSSPSTKPDAEYSIDVGDVAGHTLGLVKYTFTYTHTMQIEGVAMKGGYLVATGDVHGTRFHGNGYEVINMANGDKIYLRYSGTDKEGYLEVGTWSFTGGTGKYKSIAGKGTFEQKAGASGNTVVEMEGKYTLPAKK